MEYKWHRLSDEKPKEEKSYLVCDERGNITIKNWSFEKEYRDYNPDRPYDIKKSIRPACFPKNGSYNAEPATNVYFWTEMPEIPIEVKDRAKVESIERKIKKLKKQLADLRAEAVLDGGNTDAENESNHQAPG